MNATSQPVPDQRAIVTTLPGSDPGNVVRVNDEIAHWFLTVLLQHPSPPSSRYQPPLVLIFSLSVASFGLVQAGSVLREIRRGQKLFQMLSHAVL